MKTLHYKPYPEQIGTAHWGYDKDYGNLMKDEQIVACCITKFDADRIIEYQKKAIEFDAWLELNG